MSKAPLIYIAGPYRAKTTWLVEQNIRKAEEMALKVGAAGFYFQCPHPMTRFFGGELTDEFWLEMTLELLRRCDAVLFLEGWEASSGSVGEHEEARRLGISLFYDLDTMVKTVGRVFEFQQRVNKVFASFKGQPANPDTLDKVKAATTLIIQEFTLSGKMEPCTLCKGSRFHTIDIIEGEFIVKPCKCLMLKT